MNIYENIKRSIEHLDKIHNIFYDETNHPIYVEMYQKFDSLTKAHEELFLKQIYGSSGRQMILADIIEYIFNGRGYYFVTANKNDYSMRIGEYIKMIMYFTNLLMYYESMTVNVIDRIDFLKSVKLTLPSEEDFNLFNGLLEYGGVIGLPEKNIPLNLFKEDLIDKYDLGSPEAAKKKLNKYFDSLLPKTAGGLWHELLVYAFLLRYKLGYVIPLLLNQRLLHGEKKHLVPPDFLILTDDKRIYGIEVGMKKEIQSGSFSLDTGIPTATVDTINSRSSDRCPICKEWILFCHRAIDEFSDQSSKIKSSEIKCLDGNCKYYSKNDIINGCCPFTKYSSNCAKTLDFTHHKFANGLHYHYRCILTNIENTNKVKIIESLNTQISKDKTVSALKTHLPYYQGLESLFPKESVPMGSVYLSDEEELI